MVCKWGIYINAQRPSATPHLHKTQGTPGPLKAVPHTVVIMVGYQAEG